MTSIILMVCLSSCIHDGIFWPDEFRFENSDQGMRECVQMQSDFERQGKRIVRACDGTFR